jgi:hypothetical protein
LSTFQAIETKVLAWHFLKEKGHLANGDKRKVEVGRTLKHKGELAMCKSGLHASVVALDALGYATGPWLCRVECGGTIERGDDKLVCTERKCLWMVDATSIMRPFARKCALDVIHLWDAPAVVRRYLETGDESICAAARDAACAAASAAASAAAMAAARAAAMDAAMAAAMDAVRKKQADDFEALCLALEPHMEER